MDTSQYSQELLWLKDQERDYGDRDDAREAVESLGDSGANQRSPHLLLRRLLYSSLLSESLLYSDGTMAVTRISIRIVGSPSAATPTCVQIGA